jgi:acylphosphatase
MAFDVRIRGRVQGVSFRWYAEQEAARLGVTGWVRNEPDGSVRCVAEGPRADLDELLARLRSGPSSAVVQRVDATFGAATGGFPDFRIRAGGHPGD